MNPTAARLGAVLDGKYRLVRVMGEGGMGSVYEARHDLIGRRFAVKFLHAELAQHPDILARFRREAQAAGSLENENIGAVTDFGSAPDGAPFIVMEFLDGEDMAKLLVRTGPLPIARAAHLLIQVCRGLTAAHARGIVHRDLKPENLLVQQRGDGSDLVKILDFGIAKLRHVEGSGQTATQTGITLGTPYYMPPEQARGQKELDERADIYALGVILFELLSGRKPHNGENYNAILYSILMQAAPRIETLRPDLSPELAALVHRAMAAEPNQRFASATELARALTPFVGRTLTPGASLVAIPAAVHPPASMSASGTRAPVSLTPNTVPIVPVKSSAGLLVGLAIALLGGLGAVGWFALSRTKAGPEEASAPSALIGTPHAPAAAAPPATPETAAAQLAAPPPAPPPAPAPAASLSAASPASIPSAAAAKVAPPSTTVSPTQSLRNRRGAAATRRSCKR